MAAKAKNGVIGCGPDIPWSAKGEQLLFKALTYNQWLLVGRKTFESMGALPNRKYAVVTRSGWTSNDDNVVVFQSIEEAMDRLAEFTGHVIVSGGGEITEKHYPWPLRSTYRRSTSSQRDVFFPSIPNTFEGTVANSRW
ncbi:dihydrofolate reductase [Escherichia coli]|nr:dihydrofolate reductase [Escherichia coli]